MENWNALLTIAGVVATNVLTYAVASRKQKVDRQQSIIDSYEKLYKTYEGQVATLQERVNSQDKLISQLQQDQIEVFKNYHTLIIELYQMTRDKEFLENKLKALK